MGAGGVPTGSLVGPAVGATGSVVGDVDPGLGTTSVTVSIGGPPPGVPWVSAVDGAGVTAAVWAPDAGRGAGEDAEVRLAEVAR